MKPFLPSARLGPRGFTPEAWPRVCGQTPAGSQVSAQGLGTCEGPAEPGAPGGPQRGVCVGCQDGQLVPGPLGVAPRSPGSCPSVPL